MNFFATALGGAADGLASSQEPLSLMQRAQLPDETARRQKLEEVLSATLSSERQRFASLQQTAPAFSQGLVAINVHAQRLRDAAARIQQLEATYSKTFGVLPAELEKLGAGGG